MSGQAPACPQGDLELALRMADAADTITRRAFRSSDLVVETKADRTPVSEADRAVEAQLRSILEVDRPTDRVVGEEYGDTGSGPRRWIVDPIDGTKNFVRRIPAWATLIALEVEGSPKVGVVSAPALGRRWWAASGTGAFVADLAGGAKARMHVSSVGNIANAHISGSALSSWADWGGPHSYVTLAQRCYADRSFGDFWSHMLVAEGSLDIGIDPIASLWDLAALEVIVEEAGGTFTNLKGRRGADGGSAISTNGLLHQEALSVLGFANPG